MTIEIPLTKGQVAVVDDEDGDLAQFKWYAQFVPTYAGGGKFVATRYTARVNGKRTHEIMHRVILSRMLERPLLRSEFVDHEHGNPLLNIRSELRLASPSQNRMNTGKPSNNTSGFKGVSWSSQRSKWRAGIKHEGKSRTLGYFDTPEEAHEAYKTAAAVLFGEFMRIK